MNCENLDGQFLVDGFVGRTGGRADVRETYVEDPICCSCNGVCWSSDIERLRVFGLVPVSHHTI